MQLKFIELKHVSVKNVLKIRNQEGISIVYSLSQSQ